jgi:hypothetical protein
MRTTWKFPHIFLKTDQTPFWNRPIRTVFLKSWEGLFLFLLSFEYIMFRMSVIMSTFWQSRNGGSLHSSTRSYKLKGFGVEGIRVVEGGGL